MHNRRTRGPGRLCALNTHRPHTVQAQLAQQDDSQPLVSRAVSPRAGGQTHLAHCYACWSETEAPRRSGSSLDCRLSVGPEAAGEVIWGGEWVFGGGVGVVGALKTVSTMRDGMGEKGGGGAFGR